MTAKLPYIQIIIGASLWGIIGIFVNNLYTYGYTPMQVVAIRVSAAALILVGFALFKNHRIPKISLSDVKYFVGTGILSIVFFNWCLFFTIKESGLTVAAVLLYTAPAFVMLLSAILFQERITPSKMIALLTSIMGCSFVVGLLPGFDADITMVGFLSGIGAGVGYALYSIFGKFALLKYDSFTVTFYTFLFAAVFMLPISKLWEKGDVLTNPGAVINICCLGLLSTVLAYIFYTKGLETVESSRASIMATIEPVIAVLAGVIFFKETLTIWQTAGVFLIIFSVIIIQDKKEIEELRESQFHS
ncbi:DMT family transporter [Falsibacillus albus]|uniref:EamA family transporter n=1 Tax=Falsibacillus albus TaxID=2478915 RepID=A0A3L7JXM7_9BACI|nr:EamA family transporter [Falsibacillus albus]RLQ95547.1 EamA family transporter [Falsibacillus albus]